MEKDIDPNPKKTPLNPEAVEKECKKIDCCKNKKDPNQGVKGKIQQDRAMKKAERRNRKIPKDKCFKCKGKPDYKYRNGLLVCA